MMPEIKIDIDKGVPLRHRLSRWPLKQMEIGDSFSAPGEVGVRNRLCSAVTLASRATGMKFTVRRQPDGSYRCWRLA